MKTSKRGEFILTLCFLAFFVIMTLISMTYSPKARRMPLVVMVPGLVLCAALVVKEMTDRRRVAGKKQKAPAAGDDDQGSAPETTEEKKRMLIMFGWMVLLVGMIWVTGFLVTIPVYTILFMRSLKENWRLSIIFGVVGFIVLYFLFVIGLSMELYPGLIYQLWEQYG